MKVVVVESPSKAKTINKYLGPDYKVLASFGHVRDLPSKNGSVNPDDRFSMVWELDESGEKHIAAIEQALKGSDTLILATDPDREGEAISWHVQEVLAGRGRLKNIHVERVAFYEITKKAVLAAIQNPRPLKQDLVEAYLARRALDYLVGFTLSPILWRKLPGSKSAGRVQSVALRLVTDRECDIEAFKSQEYWSIHGLFHGKPSKKISAHLTHFEGKKLEKFDLNTEILARAAESTLRPQSYTVQKVDKKQVRRHGSPPFTTSTLQQEASRKLGFSARKTMQVAQKLYEGMDLGGEVVGLITYMRTDSVNLSADAVDSARKFIHQSFGPSYVPAAPKVYKSKAKNAQEAHEAIRATDVFRAPKDLGAILDNDQMRLYELIWKRFVACQMESAVLDQVSIDIGNTDKSAIFRASGSTIAFDGFLKLYEEGRDEEDEAGDGILPVLSVGEALDLADITSNQHFTQPPPRYTEATLVKRLEELGIGRPSTYASILSTLVERKYVHNDKKRLIPDPLGRLVTAFLTSFFPQYVEYDFTAHLEEQLDDISMGSLKWLDVLDGFWGDFSTATQNASTLTITDVINTVDVRLENFIFPIAPDSDGADRRVCPSCKEGRLGLKLGKWGAFVGCSSYPTCAYTRKLTNAQDGQDNGVEMGDTLFEPKVLGQDPETGVDISLRKGPYGYYIQWELGDGPAPAPVLPDADVLPKKGRAKKIAAPKPKRVSIAPGQNPLDITLENALSMGALPRTVGSHPETGKLITAAIGRFGPYVKHDGVFKSIPKTDDVLTVDVMRAVELLNMPKTGRFTRKTVEKAAKPAKKTPKTKKTTT